MAITLSTAARNAACDAVVDLLDVGGAGSIVLQTSGGVAVATCPLNATAFGSASSGAAALNTSPAVSDTNAAGGTATVAVFKDHAGTEVFRCSVGASGADLNISSTNVVPAGATVIVSAYTHTQPAS